MNLTIDNTTVSKKPSDFIKPKSKSILMPYSNNRRKLTLCNSSAFAFPGSNMTTAGVSVLSGQTTSNKFSAARNAYLARLSILKPGQAIDALKDDIRKEELYGKRIIAEMKAIGEYVVKTKEHIEETEEKTQFAKRDKMELFRDLSTFEFNFSKRNNKEMFCRIKDIKVRIQVLHDEFKERTLFEGLIGWLDENQIASMKELFDKFQRLKLSEQKRARMMMSRFLLTEEGNSM